MSTTRDAAGIPAVHGREEVNLAMNLVSAAIVRRFRQVYS
jgi:hypothetical protein